MLNSLRIYLAFAISTILLIFTTLMILPEADYQKKKYTLPSTFEEFYLRKKEASANAGVRPDNDEKLLRFSEGKTELAFLYIHGFGASRGEGEVVVEKIAQKFKANTYFLRLPGHGTNIEDHATRSYKEYIAESEEALHAVQLLGEKVVVLGTSTGALLGTLLAAEYPELVDGLVLVSPFYDFGNPLGKAATLPGGTHLMSLVMGPIRLSGGYEEDTTGMLLPSYNGFWYVNQYYNALRPLAQLRNKIARPAIFRRVKAPSLMIYYYRDEEHQDKTAKVSAMLEAFSQFGGSKASPLNRSVRIEYGSHVLMSAHVKSDKDKIEEEISSFLVDLIHQK